MGDIKRKHKLFARPRKLFDRARIDEENILVTQYGLKNKREIWKAKSVISKLRRQAKELIGASEEEQAKFFEKLTRLGLPASAISDVLGLDEKDLLNRRLATIVYKKKLANSPKQARQFIVHRHVLVNGIITTAPSFWVTKDLENTISLKPRKQKPEPMPTQTTTTETPNEPAEVPAE